MPDFGAAAGRRAGESDMGALSVEAEKLGEDPTTLLSVRSCVEADGRAARVFGVPGVCLAAVCFDAGH